MRTTDDQNELFVVVDKNDKVISYRTRRECHQDKNLIHRAVGVVITNSKGEILLQKRSPTKDLYPGLYSISCSGHLGKGENYEEAAKREIKEELGIARKLALKFLKKIIIFYKREAEMYVIFTTKEDGPFSPNPKEVGLVEFFSTDKIKRLFKEGDLSLTPCGKRTLRELKVI